MSCFAQRCGVFDAAANERLLRTVQEQQLERVRIAWPDLHGLWRGKTLMLPALRSALEQGVGLVSTLMLKDSSDRSALKVFEPDGLAALPGFGRANNLLLLPDPASLRVLPWAERTGWLQASPWFDNATPVLADPRRVLQAALATLADAGYGLTCGLEVEFHIYRITGEQRDPAAAEWPGEPPAVELIHPGWQLLGEAHADLAEAPLAIVQRTAQALGLPLRSLEIELGPSQVEAVFEPTDALTAADQMLLFRNGVRQALRRAGYHASFVCRPPFANVCSSGWHLHQSLVDLARNRNAFVRDAAAGGAPNVREARHALSDTGCAWLAGLLAHARGATLLCTPTVNGYGRYRAGVMAPVDVCWGRDHRGAMLRVLGGAGDPATRIENRAGEPLANPYLYIASQIHAGLDGLLRGLVAPPAADALGGGEHERLPTSLAEALTAFNADETLVHAFGAPLVALYNAVKRQELARHDAAEDAAAWQRREYFARY
jgi:glutamine synthetase